MVRVDYKIIIPKLHAHQYFMKRGIVWDNNIKLQLFLDLLLPNMIGVKSSRLG